MSMNIRYKDIPKREVDFEKLTGFITRMNQILADTYASEVVFTTFVRGAGRIETKWTKGKNTVVKGLSLGHTIQKTNPPIYLIWLVTPEGKTDNSMRIVMYRDWKVFVSYKTHTPTTITIMATREDTKYQIEIIGMYI